MTVLRARKFDVGNYFTSSSAPSFANNGGPISMSCWARGVTGAGEENYIFFLSDSAGDLDWQGIVTITSNNWRSYTRRNTLRTMTGGTIDSDWHHFLYVFREEDDVQFYVDGGSVGTLTTMEAPLSLDKIGVGHIPRLSATPSDGPMDVCELAIWDSDVSASGTDLADLASGAKRPDNVAVPAEHYWPCDEPTGNLTDVGTTGGITLTETGTAAFVTDGPVVTGTVYGAKVVSDLIRQTKTRHVDFALIADSNGLNGGFGWDHGLAYGLNETGANMYATGLISPGENSGNGSALGWGYQTQVLAGSFAESGAPATLDDHLDGNLRVGNYSYLASGTHGGNTAGGEVVTYDPDGLDVNANLRWDIHWGSFDTGAGSFNPMVRRQNAPYTSVQTSTSENTNTGTIEMNVKSVSVSAAVRNYPLDFRLAQNQITGPAFFLYNRVYNTDRATAGWSLHPFHMTGGWSLYDMLLALNATDDTTIQYFFSEIRSNQAQSEKKIVVVINSGMNDRNETVASIGPYPEADADSQEAYEDNLRGIIARLEAFWISQGWDPDEELYFLLLPSHPISEPDDAELLTYQAGAEAVAAEYANAQAFDIRSVTDNAAMVANSWYNGGDTIHLSQAGYEGVGSLVMSALSGGGDINANPVTAHRQQRKSKTSITGA